MTSGWHRTSSITLPSRWGQGPYGIILSLTPDSHSAVCRGSHDLTFPPTSQSVPLGTLVAGWQTPCGHPEQYSVYSSSISVAELATLSIRHGSFLLSSAHSNDTLRSMVVSMEPRRFGGLGWKLPRADLRRRAYAPQRGQPLARQAMGCGGAPGPTACFL